MSKEYEYTFQVKDLKPYFNFCENNGFKLKSKFKQTRTIYRNPNKTMARITINQENGGKKKFLDFKEDNLVKGAVLKELNESLPIEFTDDNAVNSILDFLGYTKDNTMERTRTVYVGDGVTFEIDEYILPTPAKVVAVEGEKQVVDKIYQEIKDLSRLQ